MSNEILTVDRVLQMLSVFDTENRKLGVNDFARLLGMQKSTALRLAATSPGGISGRGPGRQRFRPGHELGRLGLLTHSRLDFIPLARDAMERLAAETGEMVNLAVLDGAEAVNVAQMDGPHIVGVGY